MPQIKQKMKDRGLRDVMDSDDAMEISDQLRLADDWSDAHPDAAKEEYEAKLSELREVCGGTTVARARHFFCRMR